MTSPVDRLRVDLDELRGAIVEWRSAAGGLGKSAPPPVTTPQWPSGIATSAMHGATANHIAETQANMNGSAEWMKHSGNSFSRNDTASAIKMADIAALVGAATQPVGQAMSAGSQTVNALIQTLGGFGGQLMSALTKGQGGQQDQHEHHNQHDQHMNGGDSW